MIVRLVRRMFRGAVEYDDFVSAAALPCVRHVLSDQGKMFLDTKNIESLQELAEALQTWFSVRDNSVQRPKPNVFTPKYPIRAGSQYDEMLSFRSFRFVPFRTVTYRVVRAVHKLSFTTINTTTHTYSTTCLPHPLLLPVCRLN